MSRCNAEKNGREMGEGQILASNRPKNYFLVSVTEHNFFSKKETCLYGTFNKFLKG